MRRMIFLIAIFLLTLSPMMGQDPQVILPADGDWPTIVGDSIMLIGPKQEALTEEQRYFNPPYLMVYSGKEHLKNDMIRAALCDCDPTKPNRRIGVFSVAPDKQVSFSQGNLQYLPAANIWKFADTQYEYLGNANKYLSPTFRNWVDLFGWSANNTTAPFGVSTSTNVADYAGEFVDWGNNSICGDAPGTWRTMSADEWEFLLEKRKNASNLYGVAKVAGENGLIILPDDWKVPEGIIFKAGLHSSQVNDFSVYQSFTADEWKVMEEAGAVFLHASGYRDGATVEKCNTSGYYWSNTTSNGDDAYRMYFYSYFLGPKDVHSKYRGRSVRLVHDTIVPPPAPCETFKVNGMTFNMMCVEGGTFMMGSNDSSAPSNTRPAHPVTLSDFHIGQTEVTRALWRAVMDTVPGSGTDDMPVGHVTWEECQVFLTKLSEMTGKHFRLPTEAEWEYAARGGNKNKDFIYSGSDYADVVGWINYESNKIMPVAQKRCNQLGIYDMTGNSWEWCQDGGCRSYTTDSVINPIYVGASTGHVIRGGSFRTEPARCTNIARSTYGQNKGDSHISLRLVMDTVFPSPTPSKRIGVFSVAKDKQVSFSQGNLQYIQSTDTWQFAANQLEYMGHKHYRNGQLADTIEYFGWSGKNSKAPWGISLSIESSDYAGEFLDWGTNTIAGSAPNTWRTLSNDEWLYICQGRKNADQLLGLGIIGAVTGLIILPDDWQLPAGLSFTPNTDNATKNQYTYNQWAELENAGAVFIATSGYFNPKLGGMRHVGEEGHIRTNALSDNGLQVYSVIKTNKIIYSYSGTQEQNLQYAFAQRLVHDTIVLEAEPEYVDLGLSVKWATFNVGASKPEDYGDYFAWGETEPKEVYSWATYKWGTSSKLTKYNATDGKTILDSEDDAAYVHWGGKWRMPSKEEVDELTQQCNWIWTTHNNVNGYKVTGPNGNSIFLPAAGYKGAGPTYPAGEDGLYWTNTTEKQHYSYLIVLHDDASPTQAGRQGTRCFGFTIRPVYDDRVTLTVIPTPEDAKVSFLCKGYQAVGHSITVDKGKDVLYQVTNVDAGYLSQGDSIYNLINDSVLYVTLRPFSDGNWVVVDNSELTKYENYYISRNGGSFAGPYSNWDYYVLPVMAGETYRVRAVAGQLAPVWFAASTAPDLATKTRPKKVSCSDNKGAVAYVADEVTIPEGAKYLIINNRRSQAITVERKVPDPCLVVKVNDTLSINLMCVEGGTFMMGAMEGDEIAKDDEKPAHKVTLTYDYHIMQTEVTQSLWEAVMGEDIYVAQTKMANASKPAYVGGNYPMYYVRMNDALEFIDKLNAMTGMHFRLPTEAEWEYAARGGNKSKGYLYAGSNNADDVGWYTSRGGLHRVAQLKPNELGIYDMSGNVGEMCLDYGTYGETYKAGDVVNPRGNIRANGNRFWRGGSYTHSKDSMRVSQRSSYTPSWGGTWLGLRLVLAEDNDFRTIRVGNSYFDMSFVKGGTFMMGSDAPGAEADEQPVHKVSLSDYYIGQTEVTQHLWKKVMGDDNNPSAVKGNNLPITNITWNEAQQFVERLSELTGMHFRLPTEAEWEYAARGGQKSKGHTYAGSDDIDEVGWYNGNSSNKTHAVGQKQPNELGIYDMTGNVWEYCSDWHMPYSAQAQTNPTGAATGEKHVLRGGCYHYDSKNCTNTNRHSYYTPDKGGASTGLRIVLEE